MLILLIAIPLHRIVMLPGWAHKNRLCFDVTTWRIALWGEEIKDKDDNDVKNYLAFLNVTPVSACTFLHILLVHALALIS